MATHTTSSPDSLTSQTIDAALEAIGAVRTGVAGAIIGQERVIDLTLAAIPAGGHGLLVGAYISSLIGMKLPGRHGLLQSINCQFRAPCYAPNILTIVGTVTKRSEAIRVVGIGITVSDQEGTEILRADANSVLKF